jgi:integrase
MGDTEKTPRKEKTELESKSFRDGQIYLFKRSDYKQPTWFCRVKVPGAKGYITRSTKTLDEHQAFKYADDLFHKSLGLIASGQDLNSRPVNAAIRDYIESITPSQRQKSTVLTKIQYLERTQSFFGKMRLKDVDVRVLADLSDWTAQQYKDRQQEKYDGEKRRKEKLRSAYIDRPTTKNKALLAQLEKELANPKPIRELAANTSKRYSADIKQFFIWCVDQGHIDALPRFPKMKTEVNRRPHFDREDYKILTDYFDKFQNVNDKRIRRQRVMLVNYILVLSNTGIRVGEARNLKWRDLSQIPQAKGDDSPPDIALYVTGKTGPREVVSRTPEIKRYFQRILDLRIQELGKTPDRNEYIFCNADGTPVGSFKKSFNTLIEDAGVAIDSHGDRRTIYSLRHTYATFRIQEGVHQFILAKNMGTSTAMLDRHYGHTTNISSAAELTKGGTFKTGKKSDAIEWLIEKPAEKEMKKKGRKGAGFKNKTFQN